MFGYSSDSFYLCGVINNRKFNYITFLNMFRLLFLIIGLFVSLSAYTQPRNADGLKLVSKVDVNGHRLYTFKYNSDGSLKYMTVDNNFRKNTHDTYYYTKTGNTITQKSDIKINGYMNRYAYEYNLNENGKITSYTEYEYTPFNTVGKYKVTVLYDENDRIKEFTKLDSYAEKNPNVFEPMMSSNGISCVHENGDVYCTNISRDLDGKLWKFKTGLAIVEYSDVKNDINFGVEHVICGAYGGIIYNNIIYSPIMTEWVGLRSEHLIKRYHAAECVYYDFDYKRDDSGNIVRIEVILNTVMTDGNVKSELFRYVNIEYVQE